jgi:hypothetical protein
MAREMDLESPELCLTTLLGVGAGMESATPAECLVTE